MLPARVNQHVAIIRPEPDQLDPTFFRYVLVSPDMQARMYSLAGSGATPNALTKAMIEDFAVLAPKEITEQRAIAHILGTLDDKIELNQRMNETLEAMARALFKAWFVDFDPIRAKMEGRDIGLPPHISDLFPDRLVGSELGETPEGWEIGRLADIASSPRRGVSPADLGAETPYIGLEHMPRRSIALIEWEGKEKVTSNKSVFNKGEFLFGMLRPYFHKVGIAPVTGVCSTDIVVIAPKTAEWSSFVLACVSSTEFVTYTNQAATGTKMPRTNWKVMNDYRLCIPAASVALVFQNATQPMLESIVANIHQSRALATLRDTLLPKLVSGEVRLCDAERLTNVSQ